MRGAAVDMRDFADIQTEFLEQILGIRHQPASAQFGARIMGLFQNQHPFGQFRRQLLQVQRR